MRGDLREADNRDAVEARLQHEDVFWSMTDRIGARGRALRNAADLADVIVVSLPGGEDESDFRQIVGELAVKSDRPVLAVPTGSRALDVAPHWSDGTARTRRARPCVSSNCWNRYALIVAPSAAT